MCLRLSCAPAWAALAALLVVLALPRVARAQDDAVSSAEAEPTETTPPAQPSEAMERYADALALFERGDREGALSEMLRVHALLEGSAMQYVVLYNLGRVYEELFQYDRAIGHYERYLAESPEDAPDRADATASLRALERLLGTLAITTNAPSAQVWIGDAEVGVAPGELRIASGHHVLELRAAGFEPARREIDVAARTRVALDLQLAPLSDFHGLDPAVLVSTTVAAVLAAAVAVGLGVHAVSLRDGAVACAGTPMCQLDVPARRATIADFAVASDVMTGVAGVLGVASVVLAVLTDWGGAHDASPTVAITPGGVSLHGAF